MFLVYKIPIFCLKLFLASNSASELCVTLQSFSHFSFDKQLFESTTRGRLWRISGKAESLKRGDVSCILNCETQFYFDHSSFLFSFFL